MTVPSIQTLEVPAPIYAPSVVLYYLLSSLLLPPSAVRVGRYSKVQRQKNLVEIQSLQTKEQINERERKDREIYALIQKVSVAYESAVNDTATHAHVSHPIHTQTLFIVTSSLSFTENCVI